MKTFIKYLEDDLELTVSQEPFDMGKAVEYFKKNGWFNFHTTQTDQAKQFEEILTKENIAFDKINNEAGTHYYKQGTSF